MTGGDPLRVDWLDRALLDDGLPGRIGLTILPGKHGPSTRYPGLVYRRDLQADLDGLIDLGVRQLILLIEDHELARWGDIAIAEKGAVHGIELLRHPMPDGGVPLSLAEMDRILDEAAAGRAKGNVAIACMGGVGRSGMVAACALVAAGAGPEQAIAHVRAVRHPEAVETQAQADFVRAYALHCLSGA